MKTRLILLGGVAGLVLGFLVGVVAEAGQFTDAGWAFVGVVVGAGVTILVEGLRQSDARRKRLSDWRRDALSRLAVATDELERTFGAVMARREDEVHRKKRFPQIHQLDPRMHAFAQGLRRHWLADASYLGDDLHETATAFRSASAELAQYAPDYLDADTPIDDEIKNRLGEDLNKRGAARVEIAEQMKELLDKAIEDTLDQSGDK